MPTPVAIHLRHVSAVSSRTHLLPSDVLLLALPPHHYGFLALMLNAMAAACPAVVLRRPVDAAVHLKLARVCGCTVAAILPRAARALEPAGVAKNVRLVLTGHVAAPSATPTTRTGSGDIDPSGKSGGNSSGGANGTGGGSEKAGSQTGIFAAFPTAQVASGFGRSGGAVGFGKTRHGSAAHPRSPRAPAGHGTQPRQLWRINLCRNQGLQTQQLERHQRQ
jgi:hypothetical protein